MKDLPRPFPERADARLAAFRLGVGLTQGLVLFGLNISKEIWPAGTPLYTALVQAVLLTPMILLAAAGRLPGRKLALWFGIATVMVGGLSAYQAWRAPTDLFPDTAGPETLVTFLALGAALFIAHHLVEPAILARRRIAPYPAYFEASWKSGVQLVLASMFTFMFFGMLLVASALFGLAGTTVVRDLIQQDWFQSTAIPTMFALAVHLTDVRPAIIRGVRGVMLNLMAWLLPLLTAILAGFLLLLPFGGAQSFWDTGNATAILLATSAALIVFINAAYQAGEKPPHLALRFSARGGAILLAPLAAMTAWAVSARIARYGLTPDRIHAAACVLILGGYALGYAFAAVRAGPWMRPLERTNIVMGFVVVGLVATLLGPLLDPGRLSAADLERRLRDRELTTPSDYSFLRFETGRFGLSALDRLAADPNPDVAAGARTARALKSPLLPSVAEQEGIERRITMHPAGTPVPANLATATDVNEVSCLSRREQCEGRMLDVTGDGEAELLLTKGYEIDLYQAQPSGEWRKIGAFWPGCGTNEQRMAAFRSGQIALTPPVVRNLALGGFKLDFQPPHEPCP